MLFSEQLSSFSEQLFGILRAQSGHAYFRQRIIPEPHVPSRGSQARGTRLDVGVESLRHAFSKDIYDFSL